MSRENVEVVLDQFEATNERDFRRAMSHYAENVELMVDPKAFLNSGTFGGRDAVGRWFADWFATFERGYHFDIEAVQDLGDQVLVEASHHGQGRASGARVVGKNGYLYDLLDGRVARLAVYPDAAAALAAAGAQD